MSTKRLRISGAVALSLIFILSGWAHARDFKYVIIKELDQEATKASKDLEATAQRQRDLLNQKKRFRRANEKVEALKQGSSIRQDDLRNLRSPQGTLQQSPQSGT